MTAPDAGNRATPPHPAGSADRATTERPEAAGAAASRADAGASPARAAARRSRARIGAAAAASVILHLAMARGLALTSVGTAPRPPRGAEATRPITRRATADYALRAPREAPDTRPAHERPLAMAPVAPAAEPSRAAAAATAGIASWQPREAALLERLTAGATTAAPAPAPAAPARSGAVAGGPTLAAAPAAASLAAEVMTPRPPRAAVGGAAPAPARDDVVAPPAPATRTAESLLDRMAAAATRRPPGRRPLAPPPARARANVADAALGDVARAAAAPRPDATAQALGTAPALATVPAPTAGPAPRRPAAAAGAAVVAPFGRTASREADEGLSVAELVGTDLTARSPGFRGGGPPATARSPERVAAITLPAGSRARDVAEAFARRGRADRGEPREGPADGLRVATRGRADRMIDAGLAYLARTQEPDGGWTLAAGGPAAEAPRLRSDAAATGLALLSFFGAGHDHFSGPHRDTIRRGIEFLLAAQQPDGDLYEQSDPLSNSCAWLYSHAIATMALCEAVGMTGDPLVKPAAARACGFIAASRHPVRGGWRYVPGTDADLSVSGWMLVALRSGTLAGIDVDPAALAGAVALLDAAATARPEVYTYNPRVPDQRPAPASRACMTAVGTLMRLHTGWSAGDPRVGAAARVLEAVRPSYAERRRDCYLWYYASQVLVHTGGEAADAWYRDLVEVLEPAQQRDGPLAGSWDPLGAVPDRWGAYGGRLYVTALHLLSLEVPDRHLPTLMATD